MTKYVILRIVIVITKAFRQRKRHESKESKIYIRDR